jgi:UDP-N-acetyl-D-glucosamine/UDP-N-acetyl-D-galactosamine dehydrogenase
MTDPESTRGSDTIVPMPPAEPVIAVIGLGYVGLPLAVAFGQRFQTIGFDISAQRVTELRNGDDRTREVSRDELDASGLLRITDDPQELAIADVYIVTVPTPIDEFRRPDLGPLRSASRTVGSYLATGNIVIYESTVYPGATEEECGPILSATSGLQVNQGFSLGYSPERINPGDTQHRLADILKVTSGSNPAAAEYIDNLYRQIITAGTHLTRSIRVAEAAKVIENTQRDVNIALINELAVLFNTLEIDTNEVLAAAGTKWNFLTFRPGLVGGHCIGVDPYYLTHKAQQVGHHPEVILAGRRINDRMGEYVADEVMRLMAQAGRPIAGSRVLILGLAFKENCPDLRNTKVVDVVHRLKEYSVTVDVIDPWVNPVEAQQEYGIELLAPDTTPNGSYDAVVLAVAHKNFEPEHSTLRAWLCDSGVVYDVKGVLPPAVADATL